MADPTPVPVPTDQTGPLDAGHTTTEYGVTKLVAILSAVIAALGTMTQILDSVSGIVPPAQKGLGMWLAIGGVVVAGLTSVAYTLQRSAVKIAAIKAGQVVPAEPVSPAAAAANLGKT